MISRPLAVTRSAATHRPQQPVEAGTPHSLGPRTHVGTPSAGGSGPGKPRRYQLPIAKQVEKGCAVAASSDV